MKLTTVLLIVGFLMLVLFRYNNKSVIEVFNNLFRFKPPYKRIPHVLTSQNISRREYDFVFE
jgi:hypothetical protein